MNPLVMLAEAGTPTTVADADVLGTVVERSESFLSLVTKIGDSCVNNEICVAFLTVTFMGLGVRMLRRVVSAFGRGR